MTTTPTTFYRGEDPLRADKLNLAFSERVYRDGDTMTGFLNLSADPISPMHAVTKQYLDRISTGAGFFLPLAGGVMGGNLASNFPIIYNGEANTPTKTSLNITTNISGNTAGTGWVGAAANININDTLNVNPALNVLTTFQGSINGNVLSAGPVSAPTFLCNAHITGSVLQLDATPPGGSAKITVGMTVTWAGGTDMIQSGSGTTFNLFNSWGSVAIQSMSFCPGIAFMASISHSTVTVNTTFGSTVFAGQTLIWSGGSATIVSGSGAPNYFLEADHGIVANTPMLVIGPKPTANLVWGPDLDPESQQTATISSYNGTPGSWLLTQSQGTVPSQPMETVANTLGQAAIGLWINHFYGGGNADGGRLGLRMQMVQQGPMLADAFYANLIGLSAGYSSSGTDLWRGSAGKVSGINPVFNMIRRSTTPGVVGAVNYSGAANEFDYGIASGSPDDPNYPLASAASLACITIVRYGTHQFRPPMQDLDNAIGFGQVPSLVRDASGNLLPASAARLLIRLGTYGGIWPIDPVDGKLMSTLPTINAYNTDGSIGSVPSRSRHAFDWAYTDFTGTLYRWQGGQGGAILGSGSPTPGGLQIGGGILSATSSTISLDTVGSVLQSATLVSGGANLRNGLMAVNDDVGAAVIITGNDASGGPGFGVATAIALVTKGLVHNGAIPPNPVTFRITANPKSFNPPGPTNITVTLGWLAPTAIAIGANAGTITLGGASSSVSVPGTLRPAILQVGTNAAVGSEILTVNGGFVMGGTLGAGVGGIIRMTGSSGPVILNDGVSIFPATLGNTSFWIAATNPRIVTDSIGTGTTGLQMTSRVASGTQASPAALPANQTMIRFNSFGHDGTAYSGSQASYQQLATNAVWSSTNHGTMHNWLGTPTNSLTQAEWMRLIEANLIIGTTTNDAINRLQVSGNIKSSAFLGEGINNAVTLAGTSQATGTALTVGLNVLTSVPASSGGVLPQGGVVVTPGEWVDIFNTTATAAKVYGFGAATVDGAAAATGVTLSGNARCRYWLTSNSTWVSSLLGGLSA